MSRCIVYTLRILILAFPCAGSALAQSAVAENWPQWRGPLATGVAPLGDPPIEWGEDENVRWKLELPGSGHASPIVWGDRVFVLTAIPYGDVVEAVPDDAPGAHDNAPVTRRQNFAAIAVDRKSGKILWQKSLRKSLPHAGAHKSGTLASSSPVTDGTHLFAYFGSNGLYCLDMQGKLVWEKDLGDMQVKHGHGEGSSPVLYGKTLIVNWDHEAKSFVVALDKTTGNELWRVARAEVTSWSTPIVVSHGEGAQVIVSGTKRVRAYDLRDGEAIWECGGLSHNVVASPVAGGGMVFVASSYEKRAMFAIRLEGAKGDITGTEHVVWSRTRRTPYVPSPLLYGDWLYFLNHYQGVLTRVAAKTGAEPKGPFRLPDLFEIYASPVAAADRVYVTDRDGTTVVLSHGGGMPELLAQNTLEDGFNASAAIAGRELFLRGDRYLYCIAKD